MVLGVLRLIGRGYRVVPLEEPITARYSGKKCVYWAVEIVRVDRKGRATLVYSNERRINFITVNRKGEPVEVRLKVKKAYERFIEARKLSPDPFAYMLRSRPLVLDDTLGFVIREYILEV